MSKLMTKQRDALPENKFAFPGHKYPIEDAAHARNAKARAAQQAKAGKLSKSSRPSARMTREAACLRLCLGNWRCAKLAQPCPEGRAGMILVWQGEPRPELATERGVALNGTASTTSLDTEVLNERAYLRGAFELTAHRNSGADSPVAYFIQVDQADFTLP